MLVYAYIWLDVWKIIGGVLLLALFTGVVIRPGIIRMRHCYGALRNAIRNNTVTRNINIVHSVHSVCSGAIYYSY